MDRPRTRLGVLLATPQDAASVAFFGGERYEGVAATREQVRHMAALYGFDQPPPSQSRGGSTLDDFVAAGDLRNLWRHALHDGLRAIIAVAKYCDPGDDPVLVILRALAAQGYDVEIWGDAEEEED